MIYEKSIAASASAAMVSIGEEFQIMQEFSR
jgi:hypothetical protein